MLTSGRIFVVARQDGQRRYTSFGCSSRVVTKYRSRADLHPEHEGNAFLREILSPIVFSAAEKVTSVFVHFSILFIVEDNRLPMAA